MYSVSKLVFSFMDYNEVESSRREVVDGGYYGFCMNI